MVGGCGTEVQDLVVAPSFGVIQSFGCKLGCIPETSFLGALGVGSFVWSKFYLKIVGRHIRTKIRAERHINTLWHPGLSAK